jgi:HSP20 family molecular chaperone IbpA
VKVDRIERTRSGEVYVPLTDIVETRDDIWVYADMPGADDQSVDVTLENDLLTIEGFVRADVPGDFQLVRGEYGLGDYLRTFTLNDRIDRSKIEASVKNGVLKLRLPKAEPVKPKKIVVTSDSA